MKLLDDEKTLGDTVTLLIAKIARYLVAALQQ
jgi:hypothetical protein